MPIYRCKNFGNCDLADRKELIEIEPGHAAICPNEHCQKPLVEAKGSPRAQGPAGRPRPAGPQTSMLPMLIVGLLLLLIAGAGLIYWMTTRDAPGPAPGPGPGPTPNPAERVLRMEGSNTIGLRVAPELAQAFLEKKYPGAKAEIQRQEGEKFLVTAKRDGKAQPLSFSITATGSGDAFKALLAERAEIGMSSRPIKDTERQSLARFGNMTDLAHEHVIGTDGIAVIVNKANDRINVLTLDELAGIFSGRIANWSDVGGRAGAINVYARDAKSGTFDFFNDVVLKPRGEQLSALDNRRYEDSAKLSDDVVADPNGIGFIGLPYIRSAKAVSIAPARGLRALAPEKPIVATDDYALSRNLYLYTTKSDALIEEFFGFVYSPAGEDVVGRHFVSLKVDAADVSTPGDAPRDYAQVVAGAQRVNVNFRFQTGTDQINNKARRSIDAILRFISRPENKGRQLILLGFSDRRGSERPAGRAINCRLSEDRAMTVRRRLEEKGVDIRDARGFCDAMPLSLIDDEDGWQKNRRVEVWVR